MILPPQTWSREALDHWNRQQRIVANLSVITAITEGRKARALDVVLADHGVRLAYESARDTGLVATASGKVVRLRPRLRVVPPQGPQGGAA